MKSRIGAALLGLLMLYFYSVGGAALYFNYRFAQTEGFISWLLLGQFIPTAKAVVWPYYAYKYKQTRDEIRQSDAALDRTARADSVRGVLMLLPTVQEQVQALRSERDSVRIARMITASVDQIERVSHEALDHYYPGLGSAVKESWVPAMRAVAAIVGKDPAVTSDSAALRSAIALMMGNMAVYDEWLAKNRAAMAESVLAKRLAPVITDSTGRVRRAK